MALIKCRACGNSISDQAWACVRCGCPTETNPNLFVKRRGRVRRLGKCPECGREASVRTKVCVGCGFPMNCDEEY